MTFAAAAAFRRGSDQHRPARARGRAFAAVVRGRPPEGHFLRAGLLTALTFLGGLLAWPRAAATGVHAVNGISR